MIEFKQIVVCLATIALCFATSPFALAEPTQGYDQEIHAIIGAVQARHNDLANRLAQQLRKKYPQNPEVTAIWLQLQCAQGQFQSYQNLSQQERNTTYPELQRVLQSCGQNQALTQAQHLLDTGDATSAIGIAQPLYASGPDSYRAGLILAKAYVANHQTEQAQQVYAAMAQHYPKDTELAVQAQLLASDLALTQAQHLFDTGDATSAIGIAQPLYASGPDSYRAGMILAKAHVANHQTEQAQQVYAVLAQRYPKDTDLAVQSVILLAQSHHSRQARQAFSELSADQQRPVLAALAGNTGALYPMSLTITGSLASSTDNLPNDNNFGLQLRIDTHLGVAVGTIDQAHRFGQSATAYGVHVYQTLGNGYSGEVAITYSPSGTFLARESITIALSKELNDLSLEASIRHLVFSNTVANVLFVGVGLPINNTFNLRTGVFYVPETGAYSLMFNPVWQNADGGRTFAYLTAGMAGEQLGVATSVLKTPTYSIKIGRVFNIRQDVALMLDAFYEHRTALYSRSGLEFAATKRW